MNTSTLTCIGFIQSLSRNYEDAVDTFHKALGQKREDTFSSTMLTCVLEMCIEEPPNLNDYLDKGPEHVEGIGSKKPVKQQPVEMNDDNDEILQFRNPKYRLWNRRLRKKNDDSSSHMEDDSNAMVIDSSSPKEDSSYSMELSTNMSENSDKF